VRTRLFAAALAAFIFCGCASSPPTRLPLTETQLAANAFLIRMGPADGLTQQDVSDIVLSESGMTTLKHGFKYFIIVDSQEFQTYASSYVPSVSTTNINASRIGNTVYGSGTTITNGGYSMIRAVPSASNTILCFNEPPNDGGVIYEAKTLVRSILNRRGYK
jgi:hypothetical protein